MNTTTTQNEVARIEAAKRETFFAIDSRLSAEERIARTRTALALLAGISEE